MLQDYLKDKMKIEEFARKAISVPFKPHGRTWDNWDCWGCFRMGWIEVERIYLPSYDKDYDSLKDYKRLEELFAKGIAGSWKEVKDPQPMDGVMYFMKGRLMHVGLVINKDMMLHTDHGTGTTYERIDSYRVEGIYRYVR
jgi:hypothetical protein